MIGKAAGSSQDDCLFAPPNATQAFILGGISAAQNTPPSHMNGILSDVADALACSVESLHFLVSHDHVGYNSEDDIGQNFNAVFDFPDADRRRKIGRFNALNIAE